MKYYSLFLFLSLIASLTDAQRHVSDFRFASQNTQGGNRGRTWRIIGDTMQRRNIDVLAIQELGTEPPIATPDTSRITDRDTLTPIDPSNFRPTFYLGLIPRSPPNSEPPTNVALSINEFTFTLNGVQYFVYLMDNTLRCTSRPTNPRTTQNMAIISRYQASRIFVLPMINRYREYVTDDDVRPVFGIQIEDAVFFNIHSRSDGGESVTNEASSSVNIIAAHMSQNFRQLTWVIMGDYNRIPELLAIDFDQLLPRQFAYAREVVATHQPTHGSLELDYAVVGGLMILLRHLPQVQQLLPNPFGSDHTGIVSI